MMQRPRLWLIGLALWVAIACVQWPTFWPGENANLAAIAQVELPAPTATASPEVFPLAPSLPSPEALPAPTPEAGGVQLPPPPVPAPLPSAPPLPLSGTYQDIKGRFRIGLLQGYTVSPLVGSVLVEAPDGSLAYTVVLNSQSARQVFGQATGIPGSVLTNEALALVAQEVFHRGEGFQTGAFQPDPRGGIQIPWTGSLTIGGQSQPMTGTIIARPSQQNVLLLLIAATESAREQVPGVVSVLSNSLEAL